jgi:hypothetical protein
MNASPKCPHCPIAAGTDCRGQDHRIFCDYMDKTSQIHDPRYGRILVADDVMLEPGVSYGTGQPYPPPASGAGCCGGFNPMSLPFDSE